MTVWAALVHGVEEEDDESSECIRFSDLRGERRGLGGVMGERRGLGGVISGIGVDCLGASVCACESVNSCLVGGVDGGVSGRLISKAGMRLWPDDDAGMRPCDMDCAFFGCMSMKKFGCMEMTCVSLVISNLALCLGAPGISTISLGGGVV